MSFPTLIQGMLQPEAYPYTCQNIRLLQTHLSWIILTGQYAYKIKKPLNLGFQDFTTLDKRAHYCQLEVSLNKALAKDIYIQVVPITGSVERPQIILDNIQMDNEQNKIEPIEWAIQMHEFSQSHLLSAMLTQGKLTNHHIKLLAIRTAQFHLNAPVCSSQEVFGSPDRVHAPVLENFAEIQKLTTDKDILAMVETIHQWTKNEHQRLTPLFKSRKENGYVRACHGDMHLGNIVLLDDTPVIFDCIEFNESFRWTDVMADVAFMIMDLSIHGRSDLANLYLNTYLEATGDYSGVAVLPYYLCYRAMVRAKIMLYSGNEEHHIATMKEYLELALSYTKPRATPKMIMTLGVSGMGKTYTSEKWLLEMTNTIRIRSDVERKRIFQDNTSKTKQALYSQQSHHDTFERLAMLCDSLLKAQYSVIIDATFIQKWQRDLMVKVAHLHQVPYELAVFIHDEKLIKTNLERRAQIKQANKEGRLSNYLEDVSDADEEVVKLQLQHIEPLSKEEAQYATYIIDDSSITE